MNRHTRTLICRHSYIDEANGNIYGKLNAYTARIECELQGTSSLSLWSLFCVRRFCSLAPSLSLSFYPFFCFVNFLNANMRMSVYIYTYNLQPTYTWIAKMLSGTIVNAFRICTRLAYNFGHHLSTCVCACERECKNRGNVYCVWM